MARILEEKGDRVLVKWVNYDKPTWEAQEAPFDMKGRCLCPKVLENWTMFQKSLKGPVTGPVPCRIKRPLAERHEVVNRSSADCTRCFLSVQSSLG